MRGVVWFAVLTAAVIVPALSAWAHGVVGDYTFLEPIVADDADPKNEFDVLKPGWVRTADGHEVALGCSLEKKIGENLSLELGSEWIRQSPKAGPSMSGFNDLELLPKSAFLTVPSHELRFSIGARFVLPTGAPAVEDQNQTLLGPELLWVKGWGDLPNDGVLKYLRPFAFQGDWGYVAALGGATFHEMFADNVVEYSLPYLSNAVRDFGLRWPFRNLYVFTEFNYDQLLRGPAGQTFPQVLATPGIAYMDHNVQLSLATQLALNGAAVPDNHAAVLGLVDLFIDDIFPWTNWTPF
jgi:hypothetical protein